MIVPILRVFQVAQLEFKPAYVGIRDSVLPNVSLQTHKYEREIEILVPAGNAILIKLRCFRNAVFPYFSIRACAVGSWRYARKLWWFVC
jgi:hypothetical protein